MTNKRTWLGMLAMVLVLGMTVVACEEEDQVYPAELKVTNSSTANITLVEFRTLSGTVVRSDRAGISTNNSKTYTFDSDFTGSAKVEFVAVGGLATGEATISNLDLYTGYDKGGSHQAPTKKELLASGSMASGFEITIK